MTLQTIALTRLSQSVKTIVDINRWATHLSLSRPLIRYQPLQVDYQPILPGLYRHRNFMFTDFNTQTFHGIGFQVEYWPAKATEAKYCQRFIIPMMPETIPPMERLKTAMPISSRG